MKMKFVNLTPYTIIDLANGATYPSAGVCRVPETDSEFDANGVCTVTYGEAEGLPPPQDGVLYIVSPMVTDALPNRHDLVYPDTTHPECILDGRILSVPGFIRRG